MIRVGFNPYGIAYSMGLQGAGTPRANPRPLTLQAYLQLAQDIGAAGIELDAGYVLRLDAPGRDRLRSAIAQHGWWVVLSRPVLHPDLDEALALARTLGAAVIRSHLTGVLCGDRSNPQCKWTELVRQVRSGLRAAAERAARHDLSIAIENHQDFTSAELMELCDACGTNVGITFDVGNALAVGEDPVDFARAVEPRIRHLHLKDYRAHWSEDGYRLVRCPIGDGAVTFSQVLAVFDAHAELTASIECGALAARHVRLLDAGWWTLYPPRHAAQLARGLAAARARRLPENESWHTPWESDAPGEQIVQFEMDQLWKSVHNLRAMGLMSGGKPLPPGISDSVISTGVRHGR
jgi:sugar phosphate isomerase/epimerase